MSLCNLLKGCAPFRVSAVEVHLPSPGCGSVNEECLLACFNVCYFKDARRRFLISCVCQFDKH